MREIATQRGADDPFLRQLPGEPSIVRFEPRSRKGEVAHVKCQVCRHALGGEEETAHALLDEVQSICAPLGAKPVLARADGLAARLTSG